MFITNAPEVKDSYQTLVADVVNLLARIKAGEVDPNDFLTEPDSEDWAEDEADDADEGAEEDATNDALKP